MVILFDFTLALLSNDRACGSACVRASVAGLTPLTNRQITKNWLNKEIKIQLTMSLLRLFILITICAMWLMQDIAHQFRISNIIFGSIFVLVIFGSIFVLVIFGDIFIVV